MQRKKRPYSLKLKYYYVQYLLVVRTELCFIVWGRKRVHLSRVKVDSEAKNKPQTLHYHWPFDCLYPLIKYNSIVAVSDVDNRVTNLCILIPYHLYSFRDMYHGNSNAV